MHILGSREFGGADQFFVRLVRALQEQGDTVLAVTRPRSPVGKALDEAGPPQMRVGMVNGFDLWSVWRIRRLIRKHRPLVVQTYMGRATRLTRVPREMSTVHVARLGGYYRINGYYRHADAWVANTEGIRRYLVESGLPSDRVFGIGNFVPPPCLLTGEARARLRSEHGVPADARVLLAVGRCIETKGFRELLEALSELPKQVDGRRWFAWIAGDGPMRGALELATRDLELEDRVRWLGWQADPGPLFAAADLFVCPSQHEPLGNVILEAWNHGLPVVSTPTDGARELMTQEVNGRLAGGLDAPALKRALEETMEATDDQRWAWGEAGRATVLRHHSRAAVVGAYRELYALLAGQSGMLATPG
jgi:glycosyltransferase involved in cell wall biosynthesis